MINRRTRATASLYLVTDVAATITAFFAAWILRFQTDVFPWIEEETPDFQTYLRMLPFVVLAWPAVFYFQGLYQPRRNKSRVEDAIALSSPVDDGVLASLNFVDQQWGAIEFSWTPDKHSQEHLECLRPTAAVSRPNPSEKLYFVSFDARSSTCCPESSV